MGHFCGALAGLLVGIFVLDNRRVQSWETFVQWISITIFLLLLGFGLIANLVARRPLTRAAYWVLALLGFGTGLYNWVFYTDIIRRSGFLTPADIIVGSILIVLVFDLSRRLMGWPLATIAGVFLAYCFFGQYLPPPLIHRGYSFELVVEHFGFGTEGIYGTPIYVSAAYIFIFVVFAAFMERAGMLKLFNDVALGLVGGLRGGPGQVCILSSALMGTISGSGVANVVASGQFTIPLMKRFGFRPLASPMSWPAGSSPSP